MSGWLTPNLPAPTDFICRRFRIPNDDQFIRNFWGAILNLCEAFNWEDFGTMTAQQASQLAFSMYQEAVADGDFCMIGSIFAFAGANIPPHTLECIGGTYNRVDYPLLYAALDPVFIIDADRFTIPNILDRVIVGSDLTYFINQTGGEVQHTLVTSEIPAHNHNDLGHTHPEGTTTPTFITIGPGAPAPSAIGAAGNTGSGNANIDNTGGGGPHNNLQPYIALRWLIVSE